MSWQIQIQVWTFLEPYSDTILLDWYLFMIIKLNKYSGLNFNKLSFDTHFCCFFFFYKNLLFFEKFFLHNFLFYCFLEECIEFSWILQKIHCIKKPKHKNGLWVLRTDLWRNMARRLVASQRLLLGRSAKVHRAQFPRTPSNVLCHCHRSLYRALSIRVMHSQASRQTPECPG